MATDVIDVVDRRDETDAPCRSIQRELSGPPVSSTVAATATATADTWRSQHARKVAERRERLEHERLQAEKLQQQLDQRQADRRIRREHFYHIRSYPAAAVAAAAKDDDKKIRHSRGEGGGSSESSSSSTATTSENGLPSGGSSMRVRSSSSMQLVSQLNERKNQLEARVKELQRTLQEERRNFERDLELLRQSHKANVEEYAQKAQKAEWELSQHKKNEEKWKKQLESKSATAARVAQLEEDKMQLRSKLERQGSVKRKVEIIEQKAVELEKENLRLHSQLARELHRVKTEVDLRIAIQQEKLNLCAQLEEAKEKGRIRVKQLEKEVDQLSEKAKMDVRDGEVRLSQLENNLTNQVRAKDREVQELKEEVTRLQQQLQHSGSFISRTAERCRSLGDVSAMEKSSLYQSSHSQSGNASSSSQNSRLLAVELQLFAERAYQAKAEVEQRFWESEKLRVKLKTQYREEIQFLRQMNMRLASNNAMANDSTDIMDMIRNADSKLERVDELEKKVDDLELLIGNKDRCISHLEWQLIDKESTVESLLSQQSRSGSASNNADHRSHHNQQLRRRPEYRSSSSMHSHLTTPTLLGCDSRQTLLASSDSMNSLTSAFNYDSYDYSDARTDAEKINSGRSASANASYHWSVAGGGTSSSGSGGGGSGGGGGGGSAAATPSRLQPLRRTTSEGNSPAFGTFKSSAGATASMSRMYSSQASMDVAREALAVSRGLAELMQSSESLDRDGDPKEGSGGSSGSRRSADEAAALLQRSASANSFSFDDDSFMFLNRRPSGLHRRRFDDPAHYPAHYRQSSGDSHPRQSSGETDLSSSMPPSPVSSCNTMITRSSASELHCPSSPEFIEPIKPATQQPLPRRFNGIPTRPIPLKGGSRSPLPQRPLSPRLRDNYFQPLTVAPVSDSEDELGKLHARQRSGSYESLRTESASVASVSVNAVRTLQARLEMFQRSSRYSEQMSTTSGDSSIFELMHHHKDSFDGAAVAGAGGGIDSDPEERERLGSSMQQYRVVQPQPVVVQPSYHHYNKGLRPGFRSSSVGSKLETGNLKATRC